MRESAVSVTSRRVRQSDFLRQHFEAQLERVEATGAAINAAANIADRRRRQLTLAEIEMRIDQAKRNASVLLDYAREKGVKL